MTREDWSAELAHRVGREVRKHRDRQKISAQKLSERCGDLGFPIERSVLSGLESQRRTKISLAEVLVLAYALDVAPIVLLFPVGDEETVDVVPNQTASPFAAAKWFSGNSLSNLDAFWPREDYWAYVDSVEKLNAYRQHANLVESMDDLYQELHLDPHIGSRRRREMSPEQIAERTRLLERYGGLLQERRNDMRTKGMLLPSVPEELVEYLGGPTAREQLERWDSRDRNQVRGGTVNDDDADSD